MQVTQTNADGLRREYKVVVPSTDVALKIAGKLDMLRQRVQLPGFRPGRAPLGLLKKQYGRAVMGEVLEETVNEVSQKTLTDNALRPALQPKIEVTKFDEAADLEFTMAVEVLPEIDPGDFAELKLERLVADPSEEDVARALESVAKQSRQFNQIEGAAEKGDITVIDFVGSIDGTPFEGGKGTDMSVELGSGQLIPGFEDQLVGTKGGEKRTVQVKFPADYQMANLAGKDATFDVDVKQVRRASPVAIDDELAKTLGMEGLDKLKEAVQGQIVRERSQFSRSRLKRSLLDALASKHAFPVPPGMVDLEFESIWAELGRDLERRGQKLPAPEDNETLIGDTGKTQSALKDEYRAIAERRVRLGLLLAEVGRQNSIQVSQDELNRAMAEQARQFPGSERRVFDFFQKNPNMAAQLRAPILEDKVVDFILERANLTDRKVSMEELVKMPEDEEPAKPAA
jgi:trigger factor